MRVKNSGIKLALFTSLSLLVAPLTASAQMQCVIDFDGDNLVTNVDIATFIALWTAGSTRVDLNGDP